MVRQKQGGILLDAKEREAGQGDFDGKHVEWDAGYMLTYIPFEGTRVYKRQVAPDMVATVDKALENAHWGSLISLEMRGKMIVNVTVEADPLAEME